MPVSIPYEAAFFLASMAYGALLWSLYDVLRSIRRVIPHGAFAIAVEDLLFWMASGILLFLMVFDKNSGMLRFYFFMGLAAGGLGWHFLIGRWFLAVLTGILRFIKRTLYKTGHLAMRPARFLWKRGRWTAHFLYGRARKVNKTTKNHLKKWKKAVKISKKT